MYVFKRDLQSILKGNNVDVDDSFLKVSAFTQQIVGSEEYCDAGKFYELMMADNNDIASLIDCILPDGPGSINLNLDLDNDLLKSSLDKYGVSENVLFTSAFAYTLSRFIGQNNILFNIVENGRSRFNNLDSIGMYVNTLPLLVNCENQDISSFLYYMSDLIYNVMKYNYYPFRKLANEYGVDSGILFQFMPDWIGETGGFDENVFANHEEDEIIGEMNNLVSDFNVHVVQNGKDYELILEYSNKYSNEFVKRFAESYKLILHEMINVDVLSDITYITKEDIELLDSYNKTEHDFEYEDTLQAFNYNLSKYPDNILVSYEDNYYSYGQGAFIIDKIAKQLIELGVNPQDSVAFLFNRSEWYVFGVLGILSIGGIYVPLDVNLPDERIEFILKDANVKVIIVNDDTYNHIVDLSGDCIVLNLSDFMGNDIGTLSSLPVVYGELACILYTSGTTGLPKGVKITRKSIHNLAEFYYKSRNFNQNDTFGLFSAIGFDTSSLIINLGICVGASVSVVPEDIRLDMVELNKYFISHNVTHVFITTQVAKLFAETIDESSLDILLIGGDKLGNVRNPEGYTLIDGYGPTEAFAYVCSIINTEKIDPSSIGYLNYNNKVYILDDVGRRVPIGAVGELYLSGYQIADGYLNREEETKKAFIPNPFSDDEGYEVLYRTGDLVRILPDGTIGIVGRKDSQVKIRGNRVEMTEVESVIRKIDDVSDVTVQTINNNGNNELVAYVVMDNELEGEALLDYVREYVKEHKPEYMIPSYVMKLDEIPLTINAKVDKNALPEVDMASLHVEYVAPTNDIEKAIIETFEEIFNQTEIGLMDNFITLGGDSISAIRVISLLQDKGISCSARDILNYKTPYLIAQNVSEKVESVSYAPVSGIVDLLPIQEHFFNQINSDDFTQHVILKANENLNVDILQKSFDELSNIHDMLRASYRYGADGEVIQEIMPLDTNVFELNEYDLDSSQKSLEDILTNSLDSISVQNKLSNISLIHYKGESYLMIIMHHLIVDGISWQIIINDLTYIYNQLKTGAELTLTRPYPYKNWVEDVKSLVNNISEEEKQYWINVNELLDDSTIKGISNVFNLNVDVNYDADNLLMLSEEEYWALAIARAYKKTYGEDIIFNRESHGREESLANVSRTVGWFTSLYPVPVDVNAKYDDISLLNDVYALKTALNDVANLGLNYVSLIYTADELKYNHCPVTFNFLSTEFVFKNDLFESVNDLSLGNDELHIHKNYSEVYGVSFNVSRVNKSYVISGEYAEGTYIGNMFKEFIENIKYELDFIGNYSMDEKFVCCLSEPQLGIYLDEKVADKGTAYSNSGFFECGFDKSVEEIEDAIHTLISKHPILKGRILDNGNLPILVCDSYPSIDIVDLNNSELIRPFDLNECLSRFFIVESDGNMYVFYDIHHIISDATTSTIIKKELALILNGSYNRDVDLGFIYASHDSFESKFSPIYGEAHEFYKNNLSDIDEVNLLLDDIEGFDNTIQLPIRGVRDKIEKFCHNSGITKGILFNGVFAYTLSRFTGSNKVYFNYNEHGRHEEYTNESMGMYVHTIPLIVNCENMTIKEYLSNVSDLILNSMNYSVYPFRLLAREFGLANNILFEYNSDLNEVSDIDELSIGDHQIGFVSDFLCVVNNLSDGFLVSVESCKKYSSETVIRFLNTFRNILLEILDKVDLADINYVSAEDLELLDCYNQTEHDLKYSSILEAFNDNLVNNSKNTLTISEDINYTYDESAYIINQIKSLLQDNDINSNDCVVVFVDRNHWTLLSALSCISEGITYVPIDESHSNKRISFMIEQSSSKAIITTDTYQSRVNALIDEYSLNLTVINISSLAKMVKTSNHVDYVDANVNEVACILYTSGTTGQPKAVQMTNLGILNLIEFYVDSTGFCEENVQGIFASVGFDVSLEQFASVFTGGAVSYVPNDIKLDLHKVNDYFIKHDVTHTLITTQIAKLFMNMVSQTSLKYLQAAGEKLGRITPPDNYILSDVYGPTEANYISSIDVDQKIDDSSVGFLNWNTKTYILDNNQRKVPIGAVGELYISGYQTTIGYLDNPEENQKALFANPFDGNISGYERMYKTGDLARYLPDGSIGIIGRADLQVKIRGNRVELSEIEVTIRNLDYVDDVTVQTIILNDNCELVAYVVSNELNDEDLIQYIKNNVRESKPDYMVPSFVMKVDEIPLTVNGKVDKSNLPMVDLDSLREDYVAPQNEIEKLLVEAFENVFNQDRIGIYDDFVKLGGDSLTVIKLLSYLEDYNITVADVLSLRTPHAIANAIEGISLDLDIYSVESGCPLSESQLNVYLDIITNDKFDAYNIPLLMEISNKYEINDIYRALNEILNAHPILTMSVSDEFNVPYLVKGSEISIIEKQGIDEEFIGEFIIKPFDLYDSLCRFLIIEDKDDYKLLAIFHHIVFDALSDIVFKQDLLTILEGGVVDVEESFLKVSAFDQLIPETSEYEEVNKFYQSMLSDIDDIGVLMDSVLSEGPGVKQLDLDLDLDLLQSFLNNSDISENVLFTSVFAIPFCWQ